MPIFVFVITLFLSTPQAFSAENQPPGTVAVKIINRTEHAVSVRVNDEEVIFGVGEHPVIVADIPYLGKTRFHFEEKGDECFPKLSKGERVIDKIEKGMSLAKNTVDMVDTAITTANTIKNLTELVGQVEPVINPPSFLSMSKYRKPVPMGPFSGVYNGDSVQYLDTKNALIKEQQKDISLIGSTADRDMAVLGLKVANIGLDVIEQMTKRDFLKKSITLKPYKMKNFKYGQMIVLEVFPDHIKKSKRYNPSSEDYVTCIVESRSEHPLLCVYRDRKGDLSHVRLDRDRFESSEFSVMSGTSIKITEFVPEDKTVKHGLFCTGRFAINTVLTVIDPSIIGNIFSFKNAVVECYQAMDSFVERAFSKREFEYTPGEDSVKLVITDKGCFELKYRTMDYKSIDHIYTGGKL